MPAKTTGGLERTRSKIQYGFRYNLITGCQRTLFTVIVVRIIVVQRPIEEICRWKLLGVPNYDRLPPAQQRSDCILRLYLRRLRFSGQVDKLRLTGPERRETWV